MSTLKRFEPMLQPCTFFSRRNMWPSSSIFWPIGIMPTMAAGPHAVEALLGGLLEPDRLERVVGAAIGQLADGLDRIARRRIDRVGRAQLLCRGELRIDDVD